MVEVRWRWVISSKSSTIHAFIGLFAAFAFVLKAFASVKSTFAKAKAVLASTKAAKTLAKADSVMAKVTFALRYPTFVSAFVVLVLTKTACRITRQRFGLRQPSGAFPRSLVILGQVCLNPLQLAGGKICISSACICG
jgi:Na+-translocating ferredoxin:NAD+ oxidoreductase RnfD subunit